MPSSIATGAPRLAVIRTDSSPSIHIDREVTVVSSAVDGSSERPVYSTMPSASSTHSRAQSSQGPTPLKRWNSKMSDVSTKFHGGRTQSLRDTAVLDSNRDSMKALSDFLMRNEPPASNYMSRPDSDAGSLHSIKKSAFKIFGRQKSKQSMKGPKLMQLPDSAVAAKTISGARHIAISIPIEFDYPYYESPAPSAPPSRPSSQQRMVSERGAVTVLKPVVEVRESGSFVNNTRREEEDEDKGNSRAESAVTPAAELLGPETTRTLENYYIQLHRQQRNMAKSAIAEGKTAVRPEPPRVQKSYVAVAPFDIVRQDSTRTDPRHSGGTAYSTASMGTNQGHSRGISSTSSVPSATMVSSLKLDLLPPRTSSINQMSPGIEAELAKAYQANLPASKPLTVENPARSSFRSEKSAQTAISAGESTTSGTSTSNSPTAVVSTAERARIHSAAAAIQTISRSNTPKTPPLNPPPTRGLPDVPESPCIPSFLPSPSPTDSKCNSPIIGTMADVIKGPKSTPPTTSQPVSPRQGRQDRVKARKQRDMALHKDKENARSPLTESASTNPQIGITPATLPQKTSKRRNTSTETAKKRAMNTMTEIMLVAVLAPYTGPVGLEDLPLSAGKRKVKDSDSNGNLSTRGTHTPPSSSMESGSEAASPPPDLAMTRGKKPLDARRQERRVKRNMSLREKEVDTRLAKVERDNVMLLNTLSGIASSFGELSRVLPAAAANRVRAAGLLGDVGREIRDGGSEAEMMREKEGKGKASLEALGPRGEDE